MKVDQIKKVLKSNSGSLFFKSQEEQDNWFQTIKNKKSYQPLLKEIAEEANRLLLEPANEITFSGFTSFRDKGERLGYEKVYFEKRRRLNTFAIMTLIEPKHPVYLQELHNSIWSICNEYTWCLPAHLKNSPETETERGWSFLHQITQPTYSIDLFAAETAFTLSEIYKLTETILDPIIQKRMLEEIYRRVLLPFCNQPKFEWETATHNWAAVCAGSIGSAALHLMEDEAELSFVLERVISAMDCYLEGFNKDGVCMEGYGYWQYGFGYYTYFGDLLKKKTEDAINLFSSEKVHQIALFQQKCFMHKNQVVNFSDTTPHASVFLGLSHYLQQIYADFEVPESDLRAPYEEDHCSRWAPAFRNLLWFDETTKGIPWQNATYHLSDSQWFISRNEHYVFACKGGNNDEPHNHNDIGHFILQANGETFLKDLGSGMYCDGYFDEERYSFLCNGSQGHSVPIINHSLQADGKSHYSTIKDVVITNDVDTFELDMTKAYSVPTLQELTRKFVWKKNANKELILSDSYLFIETPESIIERFIIPFIHITEDHDGIVLGNDQQLKILFDRNKLALNMCENEFVNHFGEKEKVWMVDFTVIKPMKICSLEVRFKFLDRLS